jgi:hypothetical protein
MKTIVSTILVFAAALAVCAAGSANEKNTRPGGRPISVFVDDVNKGKDPFFPDSTRRLAAAPQPAPNTNSPAPVVATPLALSLKGISGTKGQRLALVNNTTLAVGESTEIRAAGQQVKIMLREIRERSVLIEVVATGEVKELKLREGI